ncbi:S8 family peptidase [Deinococcus sonorensis]|uniref:S8 family peptidase n=2 Tax=Deinococcus sonorensis TaxID=309891 RepID=A0AAU7U6I1_9DEIO
MKHRTWSAAGAALLSATLLAACGGTPQPGPQVGRHSMSGVVSVPGAGTASASVETRERPQPWLQSRRQAAVPGEYLVRFKPGVRTQAQAAGLSAAGVTLTRQPGRGVFGYRLYRASGSSLAAQTAEQVRAALAARADVESVVPNLVLHAYSVPNDTLHALQWDQAMMNMHAAWDVTTGADVTVAVVDTGIVIHPDLDGKVLPGYDFVSDPASGADGDGRDADPTDEGGESDYHGSHVAGTVAASANNGEGVAGVSWGAKIVPVRVLGSAGAGSLMDILEGLWWAAGGEVEGVPQNPHPASVVNLSLGGSSACTADLQGIFDELRSWGVTVVAAAGNENEDAAGAFPANCAGVIAVGAVGPDGKRAPYSNHGPRVDVMAPGGNMNLKINVGGKSYPAGVYSTILNEQGEPVYAPYQGTSMAAPQVSGLIALLKGREPNLTAAQVLARLRATAHPLSTADCGVANGCGAGVVDAAAFLKGVAEPQPTPVPPPPTGALKTLVFALYLRGGDVNDVDAKRSQWAEVDAVRLRSPYQLRDLEEGTYAAVAWQDLDGDLEIDDGEPVGVYRDKVNLRVEDRTDVNIDLAPFETRAAALSVGQDRAALKRVMREVLQATRR